MTDVHLQEILTLSQSLIRFPTVTVGLETRWEALQQAYLFLIKYLEEAGLEVEKFQNGDYPALLAGFPGQLYAPVMLGGHYDVVAPEPDDSQFEPYIEGDYLWGRGAADMKTVVATYLVWFKERLRQGPPYPAFNLLLVGNEERGEDLPMSTDDVLEQIEADHGPGALPSLFVAGERTEETGVELWGNICAENRGVMRFELVARGEKGHSGVSRGGQGLGRKIFGAREFLEKLAEQHLTLSSPDGWVSQIRFPFTHVGTRGIYNITAAEGFLGIEIRPIPQDPLDNFVQAIRDYCRTEGFTIQDWIMDPGIVCTPDNPYLQALVAGVEQASGKPAVFAKKMAGTSARFAPDGQGVVWGQSGKGPHSKGERHHIPSIMPYWRALENFAGLAPERKTYQHIKRV